MQRRPVIMRSLLIVATPYQSRWVVRGVGVGTIDPLIWNSKSLFGLNSKTNLTKKGGGWEALQLLCVWQIFFRNPKKLRDWYAFCATIPKWVYMYMMCGTRDLFTWRLSMCVRVYFKTHHLVMLFSKVFYMYMDMCDMWATHLTFSLGLQICIHTHALPSCIEIYFHTCITQYTCTHALKYTFKRELTHWNMHRHLHCPIYIRIH